MSEFEPSAPFSLFKGHRETIESSSSECINRTGFSSKIPDHLLNNYGRIKFILNRTSFSFVVTEDDELFMQYSSGWCKLETSFKFPNERIVHISASYQAVMITLQSGFSNNITTRVFVHHTRPDILTSVYYGEKRTEIKENSVSLERNESGVDLTKIWYRVEDLDSLLNEGEYVTYTSCAAFTCCFLTSHGRLVSCGSNQFGEIARPAHISNVNRVLPCDLDPNNNCKEPFFIKTVNGDHNIIAITKDHNILQCGYKTSERGLDLKKLTQVEKMIGMDQDEYFIDICASYYGKLYLTNKFNLYKDNAFYCNLPDRVGEKVYSCSMSGTNSSFFLVINNSMVYQLNINGIKLVHKVTNPKPFQTLNTTVGTEFSTIYWSIPTESKNMRDRRENLTHRASDGLLSDILFSYCTN